MGASGLKSPFSGAGDGRDDGAQAGHPGTLSVDVDKKTRAYNLTVVVRDHETVGTLADTVEMLRHKNRTTLDDGGRENGVNVVDKITQTRTGLAWVTWGIFRGKPCQHTLCRDFEDVPAGTNNVGTKHNCWQQGIFDLHQNTLLDFA